MNTKETSSEIIATGMTANRKIQLGLAIALAVVMLGMYAWKWTAVKAVEDKLTLAEAQHVQARSLLIEQAGQLADRRNEEMLRQFSIPFAWAIRRELMAGNLDQIDQYFTSLVQIAGFQSAILAQPDGKIVVASDRKRLAQAFASLYPEQSLRVEATKIERTQDGRLRTIIPILGLNQNLGIVVVEYRPAAFTLK